MSTSKAYVDAIASGLNFITSSLEPISGEMLVRDVPVNDFFRTEDETVVYQMGVFIDLGSYGTGDVNNGFRAAQNMITGEACIIFYSQWVNRYKDSDISLVPFLA